MRGKLKKCHPALDAGSRISGFRVKSQLSWGQARNDKKGNKKSPDCDESGEENVGIKIIYVVLPDFFDSLSQLGG